MMYLPGTSVLMCVIRSILSLSENVKNINYNYYKNNTCLQECKSLLCSTTKNSCERDDMSTAVSACTQYSASKLGLNHGLVAAPPFRTFPRFSCLCSTMTRDNLTLGIPRLMLEDPVLEDFSRTSSS